ncbi:hypothetical protein BDN72DRAFT_219812 [Pluteus cervinus]|uniref:Uncharacterized protein n=1 Tax=Pluteus cervinus TaxID=181527 RepID=A0ACD3AJF1_9AGAR|nr:hypothetical protein BDN72DRAFT_219812 [Pluteus cervinus]
MWESWKICIAKALPSIEDCQEFSPCRTSPLHLKVYCRLTRFMNTARRIFASAELLTLVTVRTLTRSTPFRSILTYVVVVAQSETQVIYIQPLAMVRKEAEKRITQNRPDAIARCIKQAGAFRLRKAIQASSLPGYYRIRTASWGIDSDVPLDSIDLDKSPKNCLGSLLKSGLRLMATVCLKRWKHTPG